MLYGKSDVYFLQTPWQKLSSSFRQLRVTGRLICHSFENHWHARRSFFLCLFSFAFRHLSATRELGEASSEERNVVKRKPAAYLSSLLIKLGSWRKENGTLLRPRLRAFAYETNKLHQRGEINFFPERETFSRAFWLPLWATGSSKRTALFLQFRCLSGCPTGGRAKETMGE